MKLIKQNVKLINKSVEDEELFIETIGRISHKSKIKNDHFKFVKMLDKLGHTSVFEHISYTFKIITNRAISHEIVRHRIASYTQESTRYVKYDNLTFIIPIWLYNKKINNIEIYNGIEINDFIEENSTTALFINTLLIIEKNYKKLTQLKKEEKRDLLPNAFKTELYMTINLRSLLNFYKLRIDKSAHPMIRELAYNMLEQTDMAKKIFLGE